MASARQKKLQERLREFETVVAAYEQQLLRYAGRVAGDPVAAQDIVQETFLHLHEDWPGPLEQSPRLQTWLYRVAHNAAVDYLRKVTRIDELHQKHAEGQDAAAPPDRTLGLDISEAAERAHQALQTLPMRERELVILKVYEEKSYREISEITGLSVTNVGYILHMAMKKLAGAVGKANAT